MEINLMYHDVYKVKPTESGFASDLYKIEIKEFKKQIKEISKFGNKGINISLTFDDGGSSFYYLIADVLEDYKMKGIFFVATKYINKAGFLSEEQIRQLESRGHIVGSHSHSHPDNLSDLDFEEIESEWKESVHILSKILGHPVVTGSIPNGYLSKKVLDAAQNAGIRQLYTSKPSCKEQKYKDMLLLGRYVILNGMTEDDVVQLIVSKGKRRTLWLKWAVLSVPKLILGNKYEVVKQKFFG